MNTKFVSQVHVCTHKTHINTPFNSFLSDLLAFPHWQGGICWANWLWTGCDGGRPNDVRQDRLQCSALPLNIHQPFASQRDYCPASLSKVAGQPFPTKASLFCHEFRQGLGRAGNDTLRGALQPGGPLFPCVHTSPPPNPSNPPIPLITSPAGTHTTAGVIACRISYSHLF